MARDRNKYYLATQLRKVGKYEWFRFHNGRKWYQLLSSPNQDRNCYVYCDVNSKEYECPAYMFDANVFVNA